MAFRLIRRVFFVIAFLFLYGVTQADPTTPVGAPDLKYKLIEQFGAPFFCDLDKWPVARPEEPRAKEWLSQADLSDPEFKAMSSHLNLQKPADHLQESEILSLYREHKMLQSVTVEGSGNNFTFAIRTGKAGEQGEAISGTISAGGVISVQHRETLWNTCPKCLSYGTRIDTPQGEVSVQDLRPGMPIWSVDKDGTRIAVVVASVIRVPVPLDHEVVRVRLDNGRLLIASPAHPLADGRLIGQLQSGDEIPGNQILGAERTRYTAGYTYDVLPAGPTGYYWAEGVLLATTISR